MKAKMKPHKLLSLLLALVMVVGMLPAMSLTAYATVTTHSVYVYDKDTGKRYAFDYYDETYYYRGVFIHDIVLLVKTKAAV